MKRSLLATLLATALLTLSAHAAEEIEDFLGLKFGESRATAKEAMAAQGAKLKEDKKGGPLTFTGGTYAGEKMTELVLTFAEDHFARATVTVKYSTDKSTEKGLALYESIRKALTEKYGAPTTAPSIPRGKSFEEKARSSQLRTVWQSKDALKGKHRSIELTVPGIGMYDWLFKVTYSDENAAGQGRGAGPRKDI